MLMLMVMEEVFITVHVDATKRTAEVDVREKIQKMSPLESTGTYMRIPTLKESHKEPESLSVVGNSKLYCKSNGFC